MNPKLPIEAYTFVLSRLRYLVAAVTDIPTFKPDGKPASAYTDLPAQCEQAYGALLGPFNLAGAALDVMQAARAAGHADAVAVYGCMKLCYRADVACDRSIRSIPKSNSTPERALARMQSTATLWATLPNVPGTNAPLAVGEITAGSFGSMTAAFSAVLSAARTKEGVYVGGLALFHEKLAAWNRLVSAAAGQGRARFKPGTPERAIIDRIPVEPSTQQPGAGVITEAASPAPGAVRFQCGAAHATSFQIWHKGPGATVFTPLAEVLLPGEYAATGLAAGTHEYQVVGENSRGTGAASAPVSLAVAAEAVA